MQHSLPLLGCTLLSSALLSLCLTPTTESTRGPVKRKVVWGYDPSDGPSTWGGLCAEGHRQSPININLGDVKVRDLPPLEFINYNASGLLMAVNNGHTEELEGFGGWSPQPMVAGGGLGARYGLHQLHFHWDHLNYRGSEHTIDQLHYPLEMHLVHTRTDLDPANASNVPNGIAVVAVFFAIADHAKSLQPLETIFNATVKYDSHSNFTYSPSALLPTVTNAWFRYNGSLTTPPCTQGVIWTLLAEPIYVDLQQLEELRRHVNENGTSLLENWRGVQPLNGRTVFMRESNRALHRTLSIGVLFLCYLVLSG